MSDHVVPNIICFQTQKQLTTLNNIWVSLKSVLNDLRACNFVHTKTSLNAHCTHVCHHAQNLLSPSTKSLSNKLSKTYSNALKKHWNNTQTICLNVTLQNWDMFLHTRLNELHIFFVTSSKIVFVISRLVFFLTKRQSSEGVLWRSYFLWTPRKTSMKECLYSIVASL